MALASTIVWELRATATAGNTNGGGFKTGASGVDYSQQNAAQYALTGATSAGAGAVILHASAAADMVGNVLYVVSGTNFTAGWYEITAVSAGVSITVDRNCTSGVGSIGVVNVGGALSLNSTLDNDWAQSVVGGNTVWIKNGSFTLGEATTIANGGVGTNITVSGYDSARGDAPTGSSRPTINCATFTLTLGTRNIVSHVILTGTAANLCTVGSSVIVYNSKAINTSTTANRVGWNLGSLASILMKCEAISYRGNAVLIANQIQLLGCYLHDSNNGISCSTSSMVNILNCIIESNVANAITLTGSMTNGSLISGNTLYGGETQTGVGIAIAAGNTSVTIMNNNIYGFTTGISDAAGADRNLGAYNNAFNNGTNYSTFTAGTGAAVVDPQMTGVAQIRRTNATTSGAVITSSGADFSTVTDGRDFVYVVSGTGITAGQYKISSHTTTTLTVDINPGDSAVADKVIQVTTGRSFRPSSNLAGLGFPGSFPAALNTGYMDIGAIQRQEDYPSAANTKTGIVFKGGDLTGTYDGSDRWTDPTDSNVRYGIQYKANSTTNNKTGSLIAGSGRRLGPGRMG